ncbi:hypothetical protein GQ53DRAFT_235935 [Thozetella sp. PMI_491]|nr:hypothetical protein GQ53DRAFT_235935 [Thozetella sp. PMI_491]
MTLRFRTLERGRMATKQSGPWLARSIAAGLGDGYIGRAHQRADTAACRLTRDPASRRSTPLLLSPPLSFPLDPIPEEARNRGEIERGGKKGGGKRGHWLIAADNSVAERNLYTDGKSRSGTRWQEEPSPDRQGGVTHSSIVICSYRRPKDGLSFSVVVWAVP